MQLSPWQMIISEPLIFGPIGSIRTRFTLPPQTLSITARLLATFLPLGSFRAELRFGQTFAESDVSPRGIALGPVVAPALSSYGSHVWDTAGAGLDAVGFWPALLPPACSVFLSVPGGTSVRYEVEVCYLTPTG